MKNNNKHKINKRKGFTLIELLAVIAIVAIFSSIAIISITKIISKNRENYYTAQKKIIILAGKNYLQDYKSILPQQVGGIYKLELRKLKNKNYLSSVVDYKKQTCDLDESYLLVHKISNSKFKYYTFLKCPDYTTGETIETNSATIEIVVNNEENNHHFDVNINDNNGIASYNYILYKNNKEIKNSKNIKNEGMTQNKTFIVSLKNYENGTYKLKVYAYDKFGTVSIKTSEEMKIEKNLQQVSVCGKTIGESTIWTNQNRTITMTCNEKSSCKQQTYTKTFDTTTKTGYITIESTDGTKTKCPVSVYVDKTPPTIPNVNMYVFKNNGKEPTITDIENSNTNSSGAGNSDTSQTPYTIYNSGIWSRKNIFTYASDSTDNESKFAYYEYTTGGATDKINDQKGTYKSIKTNGKSTIKYRACDNAGNCSNYSTAYTISIDKEPPTLPTINMYKWKNNNTEPTLKEITDTATNDGYIVYNSSNWSNKHIYTFASGSTDSYSGGVYYQYTTTGKTKNEENTKGTYRNINAEGTSQIKYRACDKVGNCSSYTEITTIKIDKTNPECSINISGTKGNNDWYTSDVSVALTKKDLLSGIKTYGLSTSATANYNKTTQKTQISDTKDIKYYGYVQDNAGNINSCNSQKFKVDKTKPYIQLSSNSIDNVTVTQIEEATGNTVQSYIINKTCNTTTQTCSAQICLTPIIGSYNIDDPANSIIKDATSGISAHNLEWSMTSKSGENLVDLFCNKNKGHNPCTYLWTYSPTDQAGNKNSNAFKIQYTVGYIGLDSGC